MPPLCTAKKDGRTEGASFAQSAKSTERKHAVLSASSAHRWLECPPSAMLEKELPNETTVYAEEGSVAYEIAEYKVRWYLGERDIPLPSTGNFNAEEIDRYTDSYAYYVTDKIETIRKSCPDAVVMVEQRLDFSNYVEDGFGTGDLVIVADDVIQVIDFKYGKGVAVSAEHNPQMMLYALGALNLYGYLYDIKTVKMAIVQPRLNSISEWELSVDELISWAENTLRPIAQLAAKSEGEFKAGHHCRFCKLRATCRKRTEVMLETAKHEFKEPAELTDDEIAGVLTIAADLSKWAEDVFAYNYIGINNSYDNKIMFIAAINQYFDGLVRQGVLYGEAENIADIDVNAQRGWLSERYDISEYTDDQIRKAKTGSYVFVTVNVTFVDAIEDLRFAINMA